MRKLILLTSLILIIGSVFATIHYDFQVPSDPISGTGDIGTGDIGTGDLIIEDPGTLDPILESDGSDRVYFVLYSGLPLNLSQNSELIKDELTELGHTDGVSCIESGNIFEISCNDSEGDGSYWLCNNTAVESFGEYNDLLTTYNIPSNTCSNNVCYLEIDGVNNPPKNIGSSSDCSNYTYSKDLWDYLDGLNKGIGTSTAKYTRSGVNNWYELGEGICEWKPTNSHTFYNEDWLDQRFGIWKATDSNENPKTSDEFSELTFEQKCNYVAGMGGSLSNGQSTTAFNQNTVSFKKFDDIQEYELLDCTSTNSYEIVTECHESPIKPKVSISLQNYPDYVIKDNIIPLNQPVIFDVSDTDPSDFTVSLSSAISESTGSELLTFASMPTQENPTFSHSEIDSLNITLNFFSGDFQKNYYEILNFDELIDISVETSLGSNTIIPGELITFVLSAKTFDGAEITKVSFDPGQREESYGQMVPVSGQFQCRESSTVSCSLNDAEYDGVPVAGSPCSCRPDSIYLGQFTANKDDTGFKRAFDGDEFSYTFPMSYPSKSSCGPTRVCEVVFEVEDINGLSSEFILDLSMPGIQTCASSYKNSILGTNSSLYVGSINDGEQTCQCKFGYEPKIDDALSQLTGQSTKSCKLIPPKKTNTTNTTKTYVPTSPSQGYSNPTYTKQQTRTYSDTQNTDIFSNESEEKGYGFLIFGLFIVLGAGTIGGFEFYERKKTGSFVNPLNNIKSLIKKKDKFDNEDKSDYKVSPIQKFITDARKAGETNDTIRQNLINSGWPEEEINKFL